MKLILNSVTRKSTYSRVLAVRDINFQRRLYFVSYPNETIRFNTCTSRNYLNGHQKHRWNEVEVPHRMYSKSRDLSVDALKSYEGVNPGERVANISVTSLMMKIKAVAERGDINQLEVLIKNDVMVLCQVMNSTQPFSSALHIVLKTLESMDLQTSIVTLIKQLNDEGLIRTKEDWDEVIQFISRFKEHPAEVVDVVEIMCNNNFIPEVNYLSFISRNILVTRRGKQMLKLVNLLIEHKVVLPIDLLQNALTLFVQQNEIHVAMEVIVLVDASYGRHLRNDSFEIVYNAAVKANNLEIQCQILEMTHNRNFKRYSALALAYFGLGRIDDAMLAIHGAELYGVRVPVALYTELIQELNKQGRFEDIETVLNRFLRSHLREPEKLYRSLDEAIRLWGSINRHDQIEKLIHLCSSRGYECFKHLLSNEPNQWLSESAPYLKVSTKCNFKTLARLTAAVSLCSLQGAKLDLLNLIFNQNIPIVLKLVKEKHPQAFISAAASTSGILTTSAMKELCNLESLPDGADRRLLVRMIYEMTSYAKRIAGAASPTQDSDSLITQQLEKHFTKNSLELVSYMIQLIHNLSPSPPITDNINNNNNNKDSSSNSRKHEIQRQKEIKERAKSTCNILSRMMQETNRKLPWDEHFLLALQLFHYAEKVDFMVEIWELMKARDVKPSYHSVLVISNCLKRANKEHILVEIATGIAVASMEPKMNGQNDPSNFAVKNGADSFEYVVEAIWLTEAVSYLANSYRDRTIDVYNFEEIQETCDKIHIFMTALKIHGVALHSKIQDAFIYLSGNIVMYSTDDDIKMKYIAKAIDCVGVALACGRKVGFQPMRTLFDQTVRTGNDEFIADMFETNPEQFILHYLTSYQLEAIFRALYARQKYLLLIDCFELAIRKRDELSESTCKDLLTWSSYADSFQQIYNHVQAHGVEGGVGEAEKEKLLHNLSMVVKAASIHNQLQNLHVLKHILSIYVGIGMESTALSVLELAVEDMKLTQFYTRNHTSNLLTGSISESDARTIAWNGFKPELDLLADRLLRLGGSEADNPEVIAALEKHSYLKNSIKELLFL